MGGVFARSDASGDRGRVARAIEYRTPTATPTVAEPTATPTIEPTVIPTPTATPKPIATPEEAHATAATAEPVATLPPADVAFGERAARVAAFLANRPIRGPLEPYAALMVDLADRYGLDWRLLPVITVKESGAGVQACGHNATGYASCSVDFDSWEAGLETSAATLASYGGDAAWQACVWNMGPDGCRRGWADGYVAAALALMAGM